MQKNVPVQNLPKNSNLEQIDRIRLDQNVQSEILEDLIGGKKKNFFFLIKKLWHSFLEFLANDYGNGYLYTDFLFRYRYK